MKSKENHGQMGTLNFENHEMSWDLMIFDEINWLVSVVDEFIDGRNQIIWKLYE